MNLRSRPYKTADIANLFHLFGIYIFRRKFDIIMLLKLTMICIFTKLYFRLYNELGLHTTQCK